MNRLQFGPLALIDATRPIQDSYSDQTPDSKIDFDLWSELVANSQFPRNPLAADNSSLKQHNSSPMQHSPLLKQQTGSTAAERAEKAQSSDLGSYPQKSLSSEARNVPPSWQHNQRLFIPVGYEKNYAYPLVVYLHDQAQDASSIHDFMTEMSIQNYVGVAFDSPTDQNFGKTWRQDEPTIAGSMDGLACCIRHAQQKTNVNLGKIFLIGSGLGGCMALRLAFQYPDRIAGVVSINGELPDSCCLFSRLKNARQIPVFLAHFRDSISYGESKVCQDLSLLHSGGFSVTLRQYPCPDAGCPQVLQDVNRWLMENVTG